MIYNIKDIMGFNLEYCIDDRLDTIFYLEYGPPDVWVQVKGRPDKWADKVYIVLNQYNSIEQLMREQFDRFL